MLTKISSWVAVLALSYGVVIVAVIISFTVFDAVAVLPGFAVGLGVCWLLATNGIYEKIDR